MIPDAWLADAAYDPAQVALTRSLQAVILVVGALAARGGARALVAVWRAATPFARAAMLVAPALLAWVMSAPSSPSDINLRSAEVFLGVVPDHWGRGLGLPTLYGPLFAPWGRWPEGLLALFELQRAVAILTVIATAALAARWLGTPHAAPVAALAMALDPITSRFAATDSQSVPEALCVVLALLCWTEAPRPGRDLDAVALLTTSATLRPEAALNLLVVPLAAALLDPDLPRRAGVRRGLAAGAALAAVHLAGMVWINRPEGPAHMGLGEAPALLVYGPFALAPFHPTWGSLGAAALFTAGVVVLVARRRTAGLPLLAVATSSYVMSAGWSIATGDLMVLARHHVRAGPWLAMVMAGAATAAARRVGYPAGAVVLAAVALSGRPLDRAPYTHGAELRFLVDHLPDTDPDCVIEVFYPARDTELTVSWELSEAMGLQRRWHVLGTRDEPAPCRIWYRSANCAVAADRSACEAFEARHQLTPLAEADLPDRPWLDVNRPRRDTIPVGLYRAAPREVP